MKICSGLCEGQVLQRLGSKGAEVNISGDCSETGPVLVSCHAKKGILKGWKNRKAGQSSKGTFQAHLAGIPAGGPYRLEARCGRASAQVREFYVGDVWLLAGQSNMQGVGNMTGAPPPHPLIHALSMRREWRKATEPLHVMPESPDFCHNSSRQCSRKEGEVFRRQPKGVGPVQGSTLLTRC
jgi:sialate O-acetylesterase